MKHVTLLLSLAFLMLSCGSSPYGKLQDARDYDGMSGKITEGFSRVQAFVSEDASLRLTDYEKPVVQLRTACGRLLRVKWHNGLSAVSDLDPTKLYHVDLIVTHWKEPNTDSATAYRITDGDKILADLSRCSLHRKPMMREVEDWIDRIDEVEKNQDRLYPNSGIFHAVCSSGMRHVTWVCPTCRKNEHKAIQRLLK